MKQHLPPVLRLLIRAVWILLVLALFAWAGQARADTCEATMTDINFGTVNLIAGGDVHANGILTVTCTWTLLSPNPPLLLLPAVTACVNLGVGSGGGGNPRFLLGAGGQRLAFDLYTNTSYTSAAVWGGPALPGTAPIPLQFAALLKLGSVSQSFPIYGRIPASALAGVGTTGGTSTTYTSSFSGHGTVSFAFTGNLTQPCTSGGSTAFSFNVQATVANDCVIHAASLDFGSNSVLTGTRRTSAALGVQCTANNPYQIVLNGGQNGSVAQRRMKNPATGETVAYTLSSSMDGPAWGDGSQGTVVFGGTGSGSLQSVPVHAAVPAQRTPSPGSYRDTVTATLYF